ncbi:MAG: FAD-dependent oxidoreductase [Oscillospiraceae bacterium]|nr:FAD-dependent oxidoreductase [Oscillospiraceae bacterium]
MNEIKITINGRELIGLEAQTILEIAQNNNIEIPTLCHDKRIEIYGACGICAVEAEGSPKLLRACAVHASDGMVIRTDTERVLQNRKTVLELLLSDHEGDCLPPCTLACPAETDCQGYAALVAKGEYGKAAELVMEKIPLPASIGRVCPHPCETACRRQLVEEPVSLASLKRFIGDYNIGRTAPCAPQIEQESGKHIAIIGGGPGGLSAAYYLRLKGHTVTIYEAESRMGGMLRYGIPEYRLPDSILQKEIDIIQNTGIIFRNNVRIGQDTSLEELRQNHDAVIVAAGAWSDSKLRCPGEELDGVTGGIKFLYEAATGKIKPETFKGLKIAVVGGGNTAMDVCRTAVRLGAEKVYNIYRRTRNEMPAEEIEITEAEEEGVIFKNLTNPIEISAGKAPADRPLTIRLQIMELGEPDSSGRRAPVPVSGKEETIEVDMVISAIGQKLNPKGFEELSMTKWGTLIADGQTFQTNFSNVFAIGDATNDGADIAVSAIGEARKAAEAVNKFLYGQDVNPSPKRLVKTEKTAEDFNDREKLPRHKTPCRNPNERRKDSLEINSSFTAGQAEKEASRCLACGCLDFYDCKLIKYANQFDANPVKYGVSAHNRSDVKNKETLPNITQTPEKCILCGLCVRLCEEEVGEGVLGFVGRGFGTVVMPAGISDVCRDCGKCAEICPTGALMKAYQ